VLTIGNQRLTGAVVTLPKPVAVLHKCARAGDDAADAAGDEASGFEAPVHYEVKGIVRRKLVFKSRPQPIVDPSKLSLKRKR
jgi:chromosome transmission fidelity protein 8